MHCNETHSENSQLGPAVLAPPGSPAAGSSSVHRSETNQHLDFRETRSSRWFHRHQPGERRSILAAFADSDDDTLLKRHDKIERCCCSAMLTRLPSGRIIPIPTRCRDRLCMTCQKQRSKVTGDRAARACRKMNSIRLITLTAPAVAAPLKDQLTQLRKALGAFRRSKDWKHHVSGGFYVIEITLNQKTGLWHPHVHVLADGSFWRQEAIKNGWRDAIRHHTTAWSIEDDSNIIVDVRKVHDGRDAARYMAKYVSKASSIDQWHPSKICEYALAVRRMRSIATFGDLHGVSLDPADPNEAGEGAEPLCTMGLLATAAAAGDGEAVWALRGLLVYKTDLRSLVGWEPPPIPEVDDLRIDVRLDKIAGWCRSVWRRWPSVDRRPPRSG